MLELKTGGLLVRESKQKREIKEELQHRVAKSERMSFLNKCIKFHPTSKKGHRPKQLYFLQNVSKGPNSYIIIK